MNPRHALAVVSLIIILGMSAHFAFGHGVGFETLPPKMLGDRKVAMEVSSTVDNSTGSRQVTFSMFDTGTGITIRDVTYHVKTIKNGHVVFEGDYATGNGGLVFDLSPSDSDTVKAEEKNSAGFFESLIGAQKNTVYASGKIFGLGGLYKFSIDVLSAEQYSSKTQSPVRFDAGISFPETAEYAVNDANFGRQDIRVVTYYDLLDDVGYDATKKAITFSMPFEWSEPNINQTSILHEEVWIPKTFGSLQASEYSASVNGMPISNQTITVDDFAADNRIVHILLYRAELLRLYDSMGDKPDKIDFALFPKSDDLLLSAVTKNVEYRINLTTIPRQVYAGGDADISFRVYDVFLQGKRVSVPYDLSILSKGREILRTGGTSTTGDSWDRVRVSIPNDAEGSIDVVFRNMGGNEHASAQIPIAVTAKQPASAPHWVKTNAKWLCDGSISQGEFLRGMGYLVDRNVIRLPAPGSAAMPLPDVVTGSCAWKDGSVPDDEFLGMIADVIRSDPGI